MTAIKSLSDAADKVPKCTLRANVDRRVVSSRRRDAHVSGVESRRINDIAMGPIFRRAV